MLAFDWVPPLCKIIIATEMYIFFGGIISWSNVVSQWQGERLVVFLRVTVSLSRGGRKTTLPTFRSGNQCEGKGRKERRWLPLLPRRRYWSFYCTWAVKPFSLFSFLQAENLDTRLCVCVPFCMAATVHTRALALGAAAVVNYGSAAPPRAAPYHHRCCYCPLSLRLCVHRGI